MPKRVRSLGNGQVTLSDGAGTPNTLVVDFESGGISWQGMTQGLRQTQAVESRGVFKDLIFTERQYISGTLEIFLTQFTSATAATVEDFVMQKNAASGYVSTLGTGSDTPFTFTMQLEVEGTDLGDTDIDGSFTTCRATSVDGTEGNPSTITINWESYTAPTGDFALSEV